VADLAKIEADAIRALELWLEEHPVLTEGGRPLEWSDGVPVALDVLDVLIALRGMAE
jgi:hypothetical protein